MLFSRILLHAQVNSDAGGKQLISVTGTAPSAGCLDNPPSTVCLVDGAVAVTEQPLHAVAHSRHGLLLLCCPVHRFTASANLHEGAVVANYPYDGFTDHSNKVNGTRNPSPDDAAFVHLAKLYARAHKTMSTSKVTLDLLVSAWMLFVSGSWASVCLCSSMV